MLLILTGILVYAVLQTLAYRYRAVDQIYTVSMADSGRTLLTWYDDRKITIAVVDQEGAILRSADMALEKKGVTYAVEAACMGEGDRAYLLLNSSDSKTGEALDQQLLVYDMSGLRPSVVKLNASQLYVSGEDSSSQEVWRYRFLNASGSTLSMIGTNQEENLAIRLAFEFGELTESSLNVKSERMYPLAPEEGIFQAVGNGQDLVYISNAGKMYRAEEGGYTEIYPAREVEEVMYPLYTAYAGTGYVYLQDGASGDILKLNIMDGSEEAVMNGKAAFSSAEAIVPGQISLISMADPDNFSSVVQGEEGDFHLFTVTEGNGILADRLVRSVGSLVLRFLQSLLGAAAAVAVTMLLIWILWKGITEGKTITGKLLMASIPLMILIMCAFGAVAFFFYRASILDSYRKQTIDEGNMMTALFGREAFDALEYPYDYKNEDYRYMENQMSGRDMMSRVIYYEDGVLYTGVDQEMPCYYPASMAVNQSLEQLYRKAALTGSAVSGTIRDQQGERVVSVTPVGGSEGRTVYLYETGISMAVIREYQNAYLKNFIWMSGGFLAALLTLLTALFLKILQPLREIRNGMEAFTGGDRSVRIIPSSQDELAGICQTFNTMADDIDHQIINLQNLSETYYRFMPLSIIAILGKDNLGSLTLGSHVQGSYAVLSVQFRQTERGDSFRTRETEVNQFFKILNAQAARENAVPIVDSANLSSILLICKEGVASAVRTAMAILAGVDAYNAGVDPDSRLNITFLLHRSDIFMGVCGDEERYIPALMTPEMEALMTHKEVFSQVGSRLLVTGQAYEELGEDHDFESRYIGRLGMESHKGGFYEFYGDRDGEEARRIKISAISFRKAIKLFEEGYYYEAKNLFSMVLQDHPTDKVVKYYIFRCG